MPMSIVAAGRGGKKSVHPEPRHAGGHIAHKGPPKENRSTSKVKPETRLQRAQRPRGFGRLGGPERLGRHLEAAVAQILLGARVLLHADAVAVLPGVASLTLDHVVRFVVKAAYALGRGVSPRRPAQPPSPATTPTRIAPSRRPGRRKASRPACDSPSAAPAPLGADAWSSWWWWWPVDAGIPCAPGPEPDANRMVFVQSCSGSPQPPPAMLPSCRFLLGFPASRSGWHRLLVIVLHIELRPFPVGLAPVRGGAAGRSPH